MSGLQLFSEPFARTGNMAAEGFKRLLGRPALGLLQTVIREGIQNVLDASHALDGPHVLIRLRTLDERQKGVLAEALLGERPAGDATRADIDQALAKPKVRVLEICDFGTEGLSGPTRADAPHEGADALNFINFLRNVGAGRDTRHGGGTYGYGKSSLYAMSSCSTIVVDSQTRCGGVDVRRLMACHLGAAFDAQDADGQGRRYTGRHWWGELDGSDSVEPATGTQAITLSADLGMIQRTPAERGTSILVIDPYISDDDVEATAQDIVETVLWNFWPRMVESTPVERTLSVELECEGRRVPLAKPEEFPPLDLFASAMAAQRTGEGLEPIRCARPNKLLGKLSRAQGLRADRVGPALRENSCIPSQASHIAVMRPVELVVKYIVGDPLPDRRFDWVGVFVCSDEDEVEEAFAQAEPPAHDDWIPDNLPKGHAKTFVNVALRELNRIAKPQGDPSPNPRASAETAPSLAATATLLGGLLGNISSKGPGRPSRQPSPGSGRKALCVSAAIFSGLIVEEDRAVARFSATLQNDGSMPDLHLVAEPHLVIDGSSTNADDLPQGYELRVDRVVLSANGRTQNGPWIRVGALDGQVEIFVPTVAEAAIGVRLFLQSGRPA